MILKSSTYLQQLGFKRCPYDASLFFRHHDSKVLMLLINVDDIMVIESSTSSISALISHSSTVFHMKDLGDLHYFLKVQVTHENDILTLTQSRYLISLLQRFGFDGAKPVSTPIASGIHLSAHERTPLDDPTPY